MKRSESILDKLLSRTAARIGLRLYIVLCLDFIFYNLLAFKFAPYYFDPGSPQLLFMTLVALTVATPVVFLYGLILRGDGTAIAPWEFLVFAFSILVGIFFVLPGWMIVLHTGGD